MAHKTLINGTAYDVVGGTTLINNTGYKISKGVTLVGGTQYDIGFRQPQSFDWGTDGVSVSGTNWFSSLQSFCQAATEAEIARDIPIGGWKRVNLTSVVLGIQEWEVMVVGVNHDANNSVTFMTRHQSDKTTTYRDTNHADLTTYSPSSLRTIRCEAFYNAFPEQSALLARDVPYRSSGTTSSNFVISTTHDYIWVPSVVELNKNQGSGLLSYDIPQEGTVYPYFETDTVNRRKMRDPAYNNNYYSYWTRTTYGGTTPPYAIKITANGNFTQYQFDNKGSMEGCVFCFMIG